MKSKLFLYAGFCFFISISGLYGSELRGKVTDLSGTAVSAVTLVAHREGAASDHMAQSAQNGEFLFENLEPGEYTLIARKPGYLDRKEGPLHLDGEHQSNPVYVRLTAGSDSEQVHGAEERNPNDFVIRLDTNAIINELNRTGTTLRFFPEFTTEKSYFGEQFGYPLRLKEPSVFGKPISAFHVALYDFHQNGLFNARPFFQVGSLRPSRRNQYGFSVSGPILAQKSWFSFQWGQVRESGYVNGNVQVPLASERVPQSGDPYTNSIISSFLKAFPSELPNLPNVSIRHLNTNALRSIHSTAFSTHVDYQVSGKNKLAFDQQYLDTAEEPFELVLGQNPRTLLRPQNLRLSDSHTVSTHTVIQSAINYDRLGAHLEPTEKFLQTLAPIGIVTPPDLDFADALTAVGPSGMPRWRFENHFYYSSQVVQERGRHKILFGGSLLRLRDGDMRSFFTRGAFFFSNDLGHTAIDNFLLGRPSSFNITIGDNYRGFRNWEIAGYARDHFRLSSQFTIDIGLRYEIVTKPTEANNLAKVSYHADANNLGPQIGFAWNPGLGKTTIRAGYTLTYGVLPLVFFSRERSNPPIIQPLVIPNPKLSDLPNLLHIVPAANAQSGINLLDPNLVSPYSHIYNLGIERELPANTLLRLTYLGSRTFKMPVTATMNRAVAVPGIDATSATVNLRRPDQRYLRVYDVFSAGNGYLDAFQASITKRLGKGFSMDARYTFSKAIDSSNSNFADTGSGDLSQTEATASDLKATSAFDTPHALLVTYSYALPFTGNKAGWTAKLLSRWSLSGTTIYRSGTPFSVLTGSDAPGFGNVDGETSDRPNILNPTILGKSISNPDTSTSILQRSYFNTQIPVGGRGNLGYGTFRKDGTHNWNLALAKSIRFLLSGREKQMQFRAEIFNLFNQAQFAAPGRLITSPTFGQITNTVNKGRVIQLMLRLEL